MLITSKEMFAKELKRLGSSFEIYQAECENQGRGMYVFTVDTTWTDLLECSFNWSVSVKGYKYWDNLRRKVSVKNLKLRAEVGEVCAYRVYTAGSELHVGCQKISRKQQRKLFNILAEQLGYTVED